MSFVIVSLSFLAELVILVHRQVDASQHKAFNYLASGVDAWLECLHVLLVVLSEHPVNLHTAWKIVTDTHTQASIVLTYQLLNMSESIMSAVRTTCFQTECSKRQSNIVADYKQPTLIYLLLNNFCLFTVGNL